MSNSELIYGFLNSDAGVTMIGGAFLWIIAKLFTVKPTWKKYYDDYKGYIIQAVKYAEKKIPDSNGDKGVQRLDKALKYLIVVNESLKGKNQEAMKQAISVIHAEAEANQII